MKNKKGFTLIELLAIIVILAIIAVITIPILLNVIENSRKGAAQDSAYGYRDAVNKYYITKLSDDRQFQLEGVYTITDGKLKGDNITDTNGTEIPISGTIPSSGYLLYSNNTLTGGCLVIGEYEVKFDKSIVSKVEKGDCSIKGDFEHDEWSTIVSNLKIDRHAYDDEIGKTKIIELDLDNNKSISNDEKFSVRLANTSNSVDNGCKTVVDGKEVHTSGFSETACGVVIEFVDIITYHRMNKHDSSGRLNGDANRGGWEYSDMRAYLNNGVYLKDQTGEIDYSTTGLLSLIPEPLKSAIIDTRVVSGHGSNDTSNFTTTDRLYLLSRREVWNYTETYDTAQSNTRQIDYYKTLGVTTSSYAEAIKKNLSDNASVWWLRSVDSSDYHYFDLVTSSGGYSPYTADYTYGVAPAFRLAD